MTCACDAIALCLDNLSCTVWASDTDINYLVTYYWPHYST